MNRKIKEIDIKAFRAYKEAQKFDLVHKESGKAADLVAIYAPNGYGKTSFFDAIEWAITGKIERLDNGKPIQEEVKKEEDYILKNRDSEELCGNITIISEDNKVFSIDTKKKTGRSKSDYRPGTPVKISPELEAITDEKQTFCMTNLLAHDKITSFLQNYTAEGKTNELKVMWDENNCSEVLEKISEIYNALEKMRTQLASDISKEEKELKQYKYENNEYDKVYKLLSNYETNYNKKYLNTAEFDVEEMLLLFNEFLESSQKERVEKEKEYTDSELLLKEYTMYSDNKKSVNVIKKKKEEYDEAVSKLEKIELNKSKQEEIERERKHITDLLAKIEEFYDYVEKSNSNMTEIKKVENSKINYQKEQLQVSENVQDLNKILEDNHQKKDEFDKKIDLLKQNHTEFCSNKLKKERYERLYNKGKYIFEQRNDRMKKYALYIEQIDLFLGGRLGIGLLHNIFTDEIFAKYSLIEKLDNEKKLLIENNNTLEYSRKNLVGLYNKIEQLSIKGRDIVVEKKQQECPLCHMKYQNYEELLNRIDVATQENIELEKLEEQIRKNKDRKEEIDTELTKLIGDVGNKVKSISDEYKRKYSIESQKVKPLQITMQIWSETIRISDDICNNLKDKYLTEELDISIYEQVCGKENELNSQKQKIVGETEKILDSIKNANSKTVELEQQIKNCQLRILQMEEENNEISTKKLYIEVKKDLEEKKLYISDYNRIQMESLLKNKSNELVEMQKTLNRELDSCHIEKMRPKDEYVTDSNECQKEINKLQIEISSFVIRCEKLLGVVEDEPLDKITIFNEDLKIKVTSIIERIQKETDILVGLSRLKEQKMWMNKKQNIETNKEKLEYLDKRIEKLQESKNYVEDYIVEKTNEYFNSDIINQIYNKIDPHPTMKHIKFITQKEKGVLKTRIFTYDETDSNQMSPVVYLSSAQVNILSLCIFLSKVLSEKNTTFNTIFIDDPIQHLDGINLLSFIDILRTITTDLGRQIVISTHNEQFYKLLKVKMDEKYYSSKFIELTSTGKIKS